MRTIVIPFNDFNLDVTNRTIIMGIINLSPESPVKHSIIDPDQVLKRAQELKKNGATIIDVGGNSSATVDIAREISSEEELNRVLPIIEILVENNFIVSLDSWNPIVVKEAANVGVHMLNDINGLRNPEMINIARKYNLPVCIMHMRGDPKRHYETDQSYINITKEIYNWCENQIQILTRAGIKREKIILDPGFEFGILMEDNLQLLWESKVFTNFKLPLLISASRKAFIAEAIGLGRTQNPISGLLEGTLAVQVLSSFLGANILRVHDVKAVNYVVKFVNSLKKVAMERNLI